MSGTSTGVGNSRALAKDCIVTISSVSETDGSIGTGLSVMGIATEFLANFKKEFVTTKAAADTFVSKRATGWAEGSFNIKGFVLLSGAASLSSIYSSGSFVYVSVAVGATGEQYAFTSTSDSLEVSSGTGATASESTISGNVIGTPQYALPGGELAAMTL